MLLRLLALLVVLGLGVGVVEAGDLQPVVEITIVELGAGEGSEDASDAGALAGALVRADDDRTIDASAELVRPPRYRYLLFVFRPPRALTSR